MIGMHTCRAVGCHVQISKAHLMCGPHWALVPLSARAAVLEAWAARQRRFNPAAPDAAYARAATAARLAVAEHEQNTTAVTFLRQVLKTYRERV